MRYRLLVPLFILAIAAAAATGCGDDDGGAAETTPSAETPSATSSAAAEPSGELFLASTTTTEDSGLLDVLIPAFEDATGVSVNLISGGSGQALELARRGDVDVLFLHSPAAEQKFVDEGFGIERAPVMHNDFVLIGPPDDPARVRQSVDIIEAFKRIAEERAEFVSRGDDSGTHVKELEVWAAAEIDPTGEDWYSESGQGQGATIQITNQFRAYALVDRGTFLTQQDNVDLEILSEGSERLSNYYHVIVVNPDRHDGLNVEGARAWASWIVGEEAQGLIGSFGAEEFGEPIFIPDAGKPEAQE